MNQKQRNSSRVLSFPSYILTEAVYCDDAGTPVRIGFTLVKTEGRGSLVESEQLTLPRQVSELKRMLQDFDERIAGQKSRRGVFHVKLKDSIRLSVQSGAVAVGLSDVVALHDRGVIDLNFDCAASVDLDQVM